MSDVNIRQGNWDEQAPKIFAQGLWDESSTKNHPLGTMRVISDGRAFCYALNGAAELAAGKLNQTVAPVSTFEGQAVAAAAPVDDRELTLTPGAGTAVANLYADGFLHINDAAGEGHMYKVKSHKAVTSSTDFTLNLYDFIRVALTTSSKWTLTVNNQKNLIISPTTLTGNIAGVAPRVVTAAYYFWNQVRGCASVLGHGTLVIGDNVTPSVANTPVAGAVEASTEATSVATIVGKVLHVSGGTEYSLVDLCIA